MLLDGDTKEKDDNRGCRAEQATAHFVRANDLCFEDVHDCKQPHAVVQLEQIHCAYIYFNFL
ncbi:hypothetical protein DPMN_143398 [Dreissena polymorpha]|uniref:Uncharacterized protein n=1 Tax=Dreissena polymorpha TaxID=45954 RepID=A0A9D4JPA6_DREPO|nr:hypothetical protein DPMN_143398 [Dreissena polymorpha]